MPSFRPSAAISFLVFLWFSAQACAEPLSKQAVLDALHSDALRSHVVDLIRVSGLAFPLTSENEDELRRAGLSDEQLRQVWAWQETKAAETLREVNAATLTYSSQYQHYPSALATLGRSESGMQASPASAGLLDLPLLPPSYDFSYVSGPNRETYSVTARPTAWHEGLRSLFTDQTAVIRSTTEPRLASASDPSYSPSGAPSPATFLRAGNVTKPPAGVFTAGQGGVSQPVAVFHPSPPYTEAARKAKAMGTVTLWVIVGPDGSVQNAGVARSLRPDLDESALETVKTWRFQPAMKDGKPVAVQLNVMVSFALR